MALSELIRFLLSKVTLRHFTHILSDSDNLAFNLDVTGKTVFQVTPLSLYLEPDPRTHVWLSTSYIYPKLGTLDINIPKELQLTSSLHTLTWALARNPTLGHTDVRGSIIPFLTPREN